MSLIRTTLAVAVLAVAGGCYRYVPVDPAAVPPGSAVRARLTDAGMDAVTRYLGPDISHVDGPLVSWNGDGLALLRQVTMRRQGFLPTTLTDTLFLLPAQIDDVGIKTLDRRRTAVFSSAMVGAAVAAVFAAKIFGGTPEEPGEGSGPPIEDAIRIRIPIRIGFP